MDERGAPLPEVIRRHSLVVRLTHWVNVVCLAMLLMSGLAIFNAHPLLYWGHTGHRGMPFVFGIGAKSEDGRAVGITRIAEVDFETTGVLGVSYDGDGRALRRAFPPWLTLPSNASLALARDWHFLLAWLFVLNGAVYLGFGLLIGLGLYFLGVPHAPLWGVFAGLMRFVPYVGAFLSAALPTSLRLFTTSGGVLAGTSRPYQVPASKPG